MKRVYTYNDFRQYLADYYQEKKKTTRHFSYRYFSQKAGINSSSFLKHVIDGKRNLTSKMVEKFCHALSFKTKESLYFRHLVMFNQAQTAQEKQEHYAVLRSMAGHVKETHLKSNQIEFFEKWYTAVVRELISLIDFNEDYELLAKNVYPPITAVKAKKAVELLLQLKMIRKKEDGNYEQTNEALAIEDGLTSMAVKSHITQMTELMNSALDDFNNSQRNISGITLGCSKTTYDVLAAEISAFKDRVKTIINQDKKSSQVYHLNIGLFPVSQNLNENQLGDGDI